MLESSSKQLCPSRVYYKTDKEKQGYIFTFHIIIILFRSFMSTYSEEGP